MVAQLWIGEFSKAVCWQRRRFQQAVDTDSIQFVFARQVQQEVDQDNRAAATNFPIQKPRQPPLRRFDMTTCAVGTLWRRANCPGHLFRIASSQTEC